MPSIFLQAIFNASYPKLIPSTLIEGEWVELSQLTEKGFLEVVGRIIEIDKSRPGYLIQRVEITDYDDFYGLTPPIEKVLEVAASLVQHGEAYALYAQNIGMDIADDFEEAYCGEWNSFKDYAIEQFDDVYAFNLCDHARSYIDYDKVARDLQMDYFYETSHAGTVHVFRHI
ncbi:MAG: antirestriction protein ArdA [Cyanobacteria bacterium P01_G01_bin.19]